MTNKQFLNIFNIQGLLKTIVDHPEEERTLHLDL